jgi:DNA-binding CsgD family transcriptional regulator
MTAEMGMLLERRELVRGPSSAPAAYATARASRDPHERLLAHLIDALTAFTAPTIAYAFMVHEQGLGDPTLLHCVPGHDPAGATNLIRRLRQLEPIDPFSPRRAEACRAIVMSAADLGGVERHARSPHGEHMRRHGYGAPIYLYFRRAGRLSAGIGLLRTARTPAFEPHTVGLLRELHPFLEHAFEVSTAPSAPALGAIAQTDPLTVREAEVAQLVAGGASNADIAAALTVSEATVKAHLTRVYAKLGVRSRTQLAVLIGGAE